MPSVSSVVKALRIARVTLSDRAAAGVYADLSGPEIERVLREHLGPDHTILARLIPDDRDGPQTVRDALKRCA